jgi:hypothetical protein
MRTSIVALLGILVLAAPGRDAAAQNVPDLATVPPPDERRPQPRLLWQPSLSVTTLGYDSNVFNRPRAEGKSTGDWVAGLAANVAPVWRANRARLSGVGGVVGNYFHQFTQERGVDASVGGRLDVPVSRLRLHAFGQFANLRQRLNYEVDERARRTEEQVGAGLDVAVGGRTTVGLQMRRNDIAFADNGTPDTLALRDTLNRVDRIGSASVSYAITPLTMLVATGEQGTHHFELSPERDGTSTAVSAGLSFAREAVIQGQWSLGWRRVTLRDPLIPDFSGMTGAASLSTTVGAGTRLGVQARRGVVFSAEAASPYYTQTSVGTSLTQALGERWEVGVRAERVWLDYVSPLGSVDAPHGEHVDVVGGSFGIRLPSGWRVSLQADAIRRRAGDDLARSYDTTRITTIISPKLPF